MLADPKAESLATNFAAQWLYLRNLKNMQPLSEEFPDFDDNLRQAFEQEALLFFESVVKEDRNVLDLMTADYTFLNERLARHYRVPNIYGSQFRRVTLTDDARRGILGKGAVLMVTSHTDRTSPVVRGKWVLENLLGAPPPAPPMVRAAFEREARSAKGKILSMRERMEEHRSNPICANCHKLMDPIGLSLENFDAIGAWRARDGATRDESWNADRRVGRVAGWNEGGRRRGAAEGAGAAAGYFCQNVDREADDLCARPRRRLLRHAGHAVDRSRFGKAKLQVFVVDFGNSEK